MNFLKKIKNNIFFFVVIVVFLCGAYFFYKFNSWKEERSFLLNKISVQQKTIEIAENVYRKQSLELKDLNSVFDSIKSENKTYKKNIKNLETEFKKRKEKILSINNVAIKWKKAYEASIKSNQEEIVDPSTKEKRLKVSFKKDFGYLTAKGYTITSPPETWISVEQNRSLQLLVVLTQTEDKAWNATATSSEDNVEIDIKLSSINPYIIRKKWYEKINFDSSLGWNEEFFAYVGTSYRFDFGLELSAGYSGYVDRVAPQLFINYSWRPFEQ